MPAILSGGPRRRWRRAAIALVAATSALAATLTVAIAHAAEPQVPNGGFETGDLTGWQVIEGDAFSSAGVSNAADWGWGCCFEREGQYHYWGYASGGDAATGRMRSESFTLGGSGHLSFKLGGGNDPENLYLALMRASDDAELMRTTNTGFADTERLGDFAWDASEYLGEDLYLMAVDTATGGFGHLNLDVVQTYHESPIIDPPTDPPAETIDAHWAFDEGSGTDAADSGASVTDHVEYVFNDAADKPDSDPLWRGGVHGGALLFDGYSTTVTRPASEAHVPGSTLAIEAWVAPRSYEWGDGGKPSVIVNQQDRNANRGYELGMGRFGTLTFGIGDGTAWHSLTSPDGAELPKDAWTHIVGVYDGDAGSLALYRNGEQIAATEVPAGGFIAAADADLIVGRHNDAAPVGPFSANMFNGLIDELDITRTVPTGEEIAASYASGLDGEGNPPEAETGYDRSRYDGDRYRPQYHFLPPEHWMNEPHAPFYYNGQYHLFYQFNPQGPFWHQIHWGHMVSDDLVNWEDAPVALSPTKDSVSPDGVWSGSATYDENGDPVLFFTAGNDSAELFQQTGLATPTTLEGNLPDWEMYPEIVTTQTPDQPVGDGLEVQYGHFRDPFVWQEGDTWYQLVGSGVRQEGGGEAVGGTALLYTSTNLTDWTYEGPLFEGDLANHPQGSEIWELPVLLPVGQDAEGNQKHIFAINAHWPDRYDERNSKSVPYWVGTWDAEAKRFIPDSEEPQLLDYGDHFTGPSGMVTPDGRSVMFTITQDGRTDQDHYDAGWAHTMGMPVELALKDDGTVGVSPLDEFSSLRGGAIVDEQGLGLEAANAVLEAAQGDMTDTLEVEIELDAASASSLGVELRRSGDGTEGTSFTIDRDASTYAVDRDRSSLDPDTAKGVHSGEFTVADDGTVTFHAFVDRSMLEVFADDRLMTTRVYPTLADSTSLRIFADGDVTVGSMKVWNLSSIYGETVPSHFEDPAPETDTADLANHDFESCSLEGWTASGDAFTDGHVTDATNWGWGGPFRQANAWDSTDRCHLWGFNPDSGGDGATGSLRSAEFTLGGDGRIDFLLSGGKDADNLRIDLVDAATGERVRTRTGADGEQYLRYEWDAADLVGGRYHIEVVDDDTGDWGHINVDDVNVPVASGG
ncbi:GH32 C-terminal domain-containing protein [Glycomyces buryatensis]|uniref:beta-fructofuranosidase n=1 Tax=Glycomyces buryatensis TaxID=2570927 RepID=A0A4S8QBH2_9ACTN|nr:GH32 C-terminal domain-containing protein [Glycomyces buryatensis]THV40165.1 cycloinulo-oligosaccharide fructanotransferase [Glycomyces buryatensis]